MKYADKCRRAYADVQHFCADRGRGLVGYIERKRDERKAKKEKESPGDRAARVTASATRWMAFFTLVLAATSIGTVAILNNQLKEMHQGGVDTHALAGATVDSAKAASDQADAAQQFSDTAEDINERMSDAVDQLTAAAGNAKASIRATQDALRLDERAWVGFVRGEVTDDIAVGKSPLAAVQIQSIGKTPAIHVTTEVDSRVICGTFPKRPPYNIADTHSDSLLTIMPNRPPISTAYISLVTNSPPLQVLTST